MHCWNSMPHRQQSVHSCGLLLLMSHVALSVCLCVGHTGVMCKNDWNDRDAVWGSDSRGSKEPCIRWESRSDEYVRSRKWWQVSDAAFCQITFDTCNNRDEIVTGLWSVKVSAARFTLSFSRIPARAVASGVLGGRGCWDCGSTGTKDGRNTPS